MTWTRDPGTGQWSENWDGTTYAPGSLEFQATPPQADAKIAALDIDKNTADAVWKSILRQTWAGLHAGQRVTWPNLVSLSPYTAKAKNGRNPRTGEAIQIPAQLKIKVKTSKSFIDEIN